jgi:hypothetical protein
MKRFYCILSLIFSFQAYALTDADEALMKSAGILKSKVMTHGGDWEVKKSEIDVDSYEYKDQGKSLIKWENLDPVTWLDYNQWLRERDQRDKIPDWKKKLRESTYEEIFAEVISCMNSCSIYRGEYKVPVNYSSRLFEGDEFQTGTDSGAWILLADGTLLRVSAQTSITLNEVNFSLKSSFISMRLNHGHIKTIRREVGLFSTDNLAETDQGFYPLKIKEANREFFSRLEYQQLNHSQRQIYLTKKNLGHFSQFKKLNEYLKTDLYLNQRDSELFIVSPNVTIKALNSNIDMFYGVNGLGNFRVQKSIDRFKSSDERESSYFVMKRGYTNKSTENYAFDNWFEVDKEGREISTVKLDLEFRKLDLLVKRIPTIHISREILLAKKFKFLNLEKLDEKQFAQKFGYRLWTDEEFARRESYLLEYSRRVETTNLASVSKVFAGKVEIFSPVYFQASFEAYLSKLKGRYINKKLIIPELTDTEYYIWVLKYAKN